MMMHIHREERKSIRTNIRQRSPPSSARREEGWFFFPTMINTTNFHRTKKWEYKIIPSLLFGGFSVSSIFLLSSSQRSYYTSACYANSPSPHYGWAKSYCYQICCVFCAHLPTYSSKLPSLDILHFFWLFRCAKSTASILDSRHLFHVRMTRSSNHTQ